ncbi:MAG: energy transducer TonB [Bryobacterales bacterium]|nr:energy transducer TonB [Bryobacterales bacterium]
MKPRDAHELHLLWEWREPIPPSRMAAAIAGILVYHVAVYLAFVAAVNAPGGHIAPVEVAFDVRKSVPLYIPKDLTQRDPNQGKITHNLDVRSAAPPAPVPQAPRARPLEPGPVPVPVIPAPIEPPKLDAALTTPPPPAASPGHLPPIEPPAEQPKLAFESVGAAGTAERISVNPNVRLPRIASSVEEAMRTQPPPLQTPQPSAGGGMVIGDLDATNSTLNSTQAPSSGPIRSNLQLLSDPEGVDFKPYLVQVLTAVRVNWMSVIPESARLGRKGRVLVQFIINRRGGVPKLVIAESSGTSAFDRAAVAGISASYPFPELPKNFKGNEIRLQLAFTYNQAAR